MRGYRLPRIYGNFHRGERHKEIDGDYHEDGAGNGQDAAAASPEEAAKDKSAQEIDGVEPDDEHQHMAGIPLGPLTKREKEHHPRQHNCREDDVYDVNPFHEKGLKLVTCKLDVACCAFLEALILESTAKEGLDAVGISLTGSHDGLEVPHLGISAVGR